MRLLDAVHRPADIGEMSPGQLRQLAGEIRELLIEKVSRTGGHLGPNLGVVELTIALHRVFSSPWDRIVWDTGHQAYVHKILTGRWAGFDGLRQQGGLSGYPARAESEHDLIENSHASTALSYADGLAKGHQLSGVTGRAVVAVVGDGALTGGMAWEALNNIAGAKDRPVIIVVNDNGRSYAPTIGGLAHHLSGLRTSRGYERVLAWGKRLLEPAPLVYASLHGLKKGVKDIIAPQCMFEDLGLKYIGPVDGHDVEAVELALRQAAGLGEPVIVHCLTRKGRGYPHAENDQLDCFHAVRPAGKGGDAPAAPSWTSVFGAELTRLGEERPEVVAVTAAMLEPTGLAGFAQRFPHRVFDVGIAEQHAATSAAGLAMAGQRPVVAIYATFLNRAFDQVLMDTALHGCPVVFVLDRAGVTGDDGPSHNGMWDLSLLQVVPGLRIAAPRDAATLREELREALEITDGPSVIRFPKGPAGDDIPALERLGGVDILHQAPEPDILLVCAGAMARAGVEAAALLAGQGTGVTVADPRWLSPVSPALAGLAAGHRLVATVEDNVRVSGFGSALALALADAGVTVPTATFGLPKQFLPHGKRADVLAQCGLTAPKIALALTERLAALPQAGGPQAGGLQPGGPRLDPSLAGRGAAR
jgi:1-deoxy-D-xylulose-5-phosphate synthase